MSHALPAAAGARLQETFAALCRIESPTGRERGCAEWIRSALTELGLEVVEDDVGPQVGADSGNLLVRVPGRGPDWVMLCAHMDTVPLTAPVEPVLRDGVWGNAHPGILGADNKAAVAALVELARHFAAPGAAPPDVGVELLFTVSEETGLKGAAAFDVTALRSKCGFVFDHATPFGDVIIASPTHMRVVATVRGRAAHAGIAPETGRNAIVAAARAVAAMPHGRLDAETTVNVGLISGGTATNVVAEECRLEAEVRSIETQRADEVVTAVLDAIQDGADHSACDVDVTLERLFQGYRLRAGDPLVELAGRALRRIGHEPRLIASGGGSDVNALRAAGFPCLNLANGTDHPHEPIESVSADALMTGLALACALVAEAAVPGSEAAPAAQATAEVHR
jgi:tripeptide aminopeptidase